MSSCDRRRGGRGERSIARRESRSRADDHDAGGTPTTDGRRVGHRVANGAVFYEKVDLVAGASASADAETGRGDEHLAKDAEDAMMATKVTNLFATTTRRTAMSTTTKNGHGHTVDDARRLIATATELRAEFERGQSAQREKISATAWRQSLARYAGG